VASRLAARQVRPLTIRLACLLPAIRARARGDSAVAIATLSVLIVLPGSIAPFTVFFGKVVSLMSTIWRRRLQGLGDFSKRSGQMRGTVAA
jgi:hypothetical protein